MNMKYTSGNNKCNFCDNNKYVDRLNNKGVLENYCVECISNLNRNKNG
jgi:hypothetical protein